MKRSQFMNNKNVDIDLSFNKNEYFKIQTGISPWKDSLYLYYFNNRNLDLPENEIENTNDIVITKSKRRDETLVCFQTKAEFGVYKNVLKYEYFTLIKELDCELWASLDIRKPFKLVQKEKVLYLNRIPMTSVIRELKPDFGSWYIYHPLQLKTTLYNIAQERNAIQNIKNRFMQKKALLELEKSYEGILGNFFDDEPDVEVFINNYAQFW